MKKSQKITVTLNVTYEEIYAALEAVGRVATVANVVEVTKYLKATARDAAADALVDWEEQHKIN